MTKQDVLYAMELSALAYHEVQPELPRYKLSVIDDSNSGVQCYIRKAGDVLTITFRGSNSKQDWQNNLAFGKMTIPYGNEQSPIRVHHGFLRAYQSPNVRDRLHAMMTDDIRCVRVYGHSLGAALAVLCSVDLDYNFPDRDYETLVFGCPRVGNRAFAKSYNKRMFKTVRVENGNDIVTKVPPAAMGFRHVGMRLHIGQPRMFGIFGFRQHEPCRYYSTLLSRFLC